MVGSAVAMVSTNSVSLHPTFDLAAKDAVKAIGERLGKTALTLVGQGGLLDVTVDPAFAGNRLLWLAYSEPAADGGNSTAVAHARLSTNGTTLEDVTVVFRQSPRYPGRLHFGARVVFARDGTLFATLGERFRDRWRQQAQDLRSHLGKVVRLQPDGTAPGDNPFIGRDDALPEIWSYGHRNV